MRWRIWHLADACRVELFHLLTITPPRSGGSGLTGKSGRKTANVCDASTREMNINTAANFMLVAFIKINRLSSFFSEICRPKFSKLQCLYVGALLIDVQCHHRTAYAFGVVRRKSVRFSIMHCNTHLPWLLRNTIPLALLVNRRNNLRLGRR